MRNYPLVMTLAILAFLELSCNKFRDYLPGKKHHLLQYRIKTFKPDMINLPPLNFTIFYNHAGDPDSAVAEGRHIIRFSYDNKRRLIGHSYEMYDPEPNFESSREVLGRHWYWYKGDKIIKDSQWVDILYRGENPLDDWYEKTTEFFYDQWGRIIKDTFLEKSTHQGGTEVKWDITVYPYDNNGNLIFYNSLSPGPNPQPQPARYDNNPSYLLTHPIWMFLTRNYSRNNEVGAIGYNAAGLPLGFNNDPLGGSRQALFGFISFQGYRFLEITYERVP